MKSPGIPLLVAALCATPLLSAQQMTVLEEDFAYGAGFPPSAWSQQPGGMTIGWQDGGVAGQYGTAFHNDLGTLAGTVLDNRLVSPSVDLGAMSVAQLEFENRVRWSSFMAHHPLGSGNGESHVEVSTDGGATWSPIWSETRTSDGVETSTLNLAAHVGEPAVRFGFRYVGNGAHEWTVDDVTVSGVAPLSPVLTTSGSCPGLVVFTATGCSPSGAVFFGWSSTLGSAAVPVGSCAGTISGLGGTPALVGIGTATSGGSSSLLVSLPSAACGNTYVQALDAASCGPSNVIQR